ncbi:MAG: thiamine pyrophosphate-dependent dehydrogenase E1 component subunit alpha [Planctomycetota bacterium]|jgi:pyruvate dehydrogenase E1 component alpha subunit|nr:MAG: thiamine pyrophosphate-dependent dehydrogenase E1 component subunit alpha [Planctomycetota bacterium]RLS96306.1 MAG: thiamine pyrophosphate-dependent dehydrogenase E1 component subunit alpha [Planctomycetota bacterium]
MPITTVFTAEIKKISILDEHANFDEKLGDGLIPNEDLLKLYEAMVACRHLDEVAFRLQRSGRMGTYPQNMGQEATSLGAAYVLRKDDWMVTCYRENCGLFWRGVPMEAILLHWMGDERGNAMPKPHWVTPIYVPLGTQMLHAAGLTLAAKYRGIDRIACTFFGDGAASEGDFHEACNFASNLEIPVVFVCQNNFWAISTPSKINSAAPTFAQRGISYGMPCVQVDGNDIFATVYAMKQAMEYTRKHGKPYFIEMVTYRLADHTTADDAKRYREDAEVESWRRKDPIIRLNAHLKNLRIWDDDKEVALKEKVALDIAAAVARAENITPPERTDAFDNMYAETPADLALQRDTRHTHSLGQDPSQLPIEAQERAAQMDAAAFAAHAAH